MRCTASQCYDYEQPGHYADGSIYSHADEAHVNHAAGVALTAAIEAAYRAVRRARVR